MCCYGGVLMLVDISVGGKPSCRKIITPVPAREEMAFEMKGRQSPGDLYRSTVGWLAAILLIPGAAQLGRNTPPIAD